MAAQPAGERAAFPVGWYGKVPCAGDFVARRLPGPFREAWDRWLQDALQAASRRLGAGWRDEFLSMPLWRFALAPGLAGAGACAGVLAPSVDSHDRCFPFTVAAALPAHALAPAELLFAVRGWFEELERIALLALDPRADLERLASELAAQPFREAWLDEPARARREAELAPRRELAPIAGAAPRAAWFAEASDVFDRMLLVCDELPPGDAFCAMLDGRWSEHGWRGGERQPVS